MEFSPMIDEAGNLGYQNYLRVKDRVLGLMKSALARAGETKPSKYWTEELAGFEYMFDASPLLINKLKHHSYHITGLKVYEYRSSQEGLKATFEKKYNELKNADRRNLFVPEAKALGGFGHQLADGLVNVDTLKFYESLIALDRAGVLPELQKTENPLVVEVGSGWGGFAYQFKKIAPKATYIMVDFPEVFLFSATYLMTLFPQAKCLFVDSPAEVTEFQQNAKAYDFIFLPQDLFSSTWTLPVDLALNMVSFQEMRSDQVDAYARAFLKAGVKWVYSHNRDRSKHNSELSAVSDILGQYYDLQRVQFMTGSYTDLAARYMNGQSTVQAPQAKPKKPVKPGGLVQRMLFHRPNLRAKMKNLVLLPQEQTLLQKAGVKTKSAPAVKPGDHWMDYRHLIGKPKSSH